MWTPRTCRLVLLKRRGQRHQAKTPLAAPKRHIAAHGVHEFVASQIDGLFGYAAHGVQSVELLLALIEDCGVLAKSLGGCRVEVAQALRRLSGNVTQAPVTRHGNSEKISAKALAFREKRTKLVSCLRWKSDD
jgi:hypothetical protein